MNERVGRRGGATRRLPRALVVMRHRDFALVEVGNAISQMGMFTQLIALGWGLRELTDWPFAVSLSLVAQFGPALVLSPFAGSVADRFDRRRVVIVGNLAATVPPLIIGLLVAAGTQTVPAMLLLAAAGGIAQAMAQPAQQAILPSLVPEAELGQAVAAASTMGNLMRVAGPSFGAFVISAFGLDWAFMFNALSFLAVVAAWSFVRPAREERPVTRPKYREQIVEGVIYARKDAQVRLFLTITFFNSVFVFHSALLPLIVRDVLDAEAGVYGLLYSIGGVGAIVGAIAAGEVRTDRRRQIAVASGVTAVGCGYLGIALSTSVAVTCVFMAIWGLGFFLVSTVSQTVLITVTPDQYRGRVMGLASMMMGGGIPIAGLVAGGLASSVGVEATVAVSAASLLGLAAWLIVGRRLTAIGIEHLTRS